MFKKFLIVLCTLLVPFLLVSCDTNGDTSKPNGENNVTTPNVDNKVTFPDVSEIKFTETNQKDFSNKLYPLIFEWRYLARDFEATIEESFKKEYNFFTPNNSNDTKEQIGSAVLEGKQKGIVVSDYEKEILTAETTDNSTVNGKINGENITDIVSQHLGNRKHHFQKDGDKFALYSSDNKKMYGGENFSRIVQRNYRLFVVNYGQCWDQGSKCYIADNAIKYETTYPDGSRYLFLAIMTKDGISITNEGTYLNDYYVNVTTDTIKERLPIPSTIKATIKSKATIIFKDVTLEPIDTSNYN